jgi:pyrimidine-nucleoside phosphorylase
LFLRVAGAVVPKLGVPGRPAGGVDCLAQIPNYRYALKTIDVEKGLDTNGYVHFIGEEIAPLDLRLFRLRQQHSAQDVPTLVAASLMAKKLAVGVLHAGLDIRVAPHGNFGRTWESATQNAHLFIDVGHRLGISAAPVLTDGRFPYQPYIGRKEALVALYKLFDAQLSPWLTEHFDACRTMALACTPHDRRPHVQHASAADLQKAFEGNVNLQGGRVESLRELLNRTDAAHRFTISATQDGFVSFNLDGVRRILVERQRTRITESNEFPDPVGILFTKRPGEWVQRGDCLATLRIDDATDLDVLNELAGSSIAVQSQSASTGLEGVPA